MRIRLGRHFGAACLSLLLACGIVGCSSDQGQQELEDIEQGEDLDSNALDGEEYEQVNNMSGDYQEEEGASDDEFVNFGNQGFNNFDSAGNESGNQMEGFNNFPTDGGMTNPAPVETFASNTAEPAPSMPMPAQAAPMSMSSGTAGASAGQGLPEIGSKMPYFVVRGDTLGKISERIYGTTAKWREIANLSDLVNPSRIYPGDVVYYQLTPEALAFASVYENTPQEEFAVNGSESLYSVSKKIYGTTSKWKEIWRHNDKIDNPDVLNQVSVIYYLPVADQLSSTSNEVIEKDLMVDYVAKSESTWAQNKANEWKYSKKQV
jgi:hypothetical protein